MKQCMKTYKCSTLLFMVQIKKKDKYTEIVGRMYFCDHVCVCLYVWGYMVSMQRLHLCVLMWCVSKMFEVYASLDFVFCLYEAVYMRKMDVTWNRCIYYFIIFRPHFLDSYVQDMDCVLTDVRPSFSL